MKKSMHLLLVSLVCACAIALVACGGSGNSSSAPDDGAAAEVESEAVVQDDQSEKFIGTWKIATFEGQGFTMVGDFTEYAGPAFQGVDTSQVAEPGDIVVLTIDKDGVGSMSIAGESTSLTWELLDDDTLVAKPEQAESANSGARLAGATELSFAYADDALKTSVSSDSNTYAMTFTADGTIAGYPMVDFAAATAITSVDQCVGTWEMRALRMTDTTMYGDTSTFDEALNGDTNSHLTIGDDGSVSFLGADMTLLIDDEGSVISVGELELPIGQFGDMLAIDMSATNGEEAIFCYGK